MTILQETHQQSARLALATDDFWECFEQVEQAFTAMSRARDQLSYLKLVGTLPPEKKLEVETISTQIDGIEQAILIIRDMLNAHPLHRYQTQGESLKFEVVT